MKRYIITVNQAIIKEEGSRPIHVHDTQTDERSDVYSVAGYGTFHVLRSYDNPRQDGARVWIEFDGVIDTCP